jgi:hypothetical protein
MDILSGLITGGKSSYAYVTAQTVLNFFFPDHPVIILNWDARGKNNIDLKKSERSNMRKT